MPHAPDLSGCALEERYELHALIGEGAFGRVYRGHDRRLERTVAVKVIKPWWAEDPEWAASFEREARLLARLSDPGIVQIFDVGRAQEGLYYVSELVPGESLAARLARGPLVPWTAAAVAEQLCRALARAHGEHVVHRDVKPANILLTPDGEVKVGDFGVARLAEGSSDGVGATVVGTPRYMAPEQARGHATTPATDVYSAGIVLYEMIAGRPPFTERAAVELALRHLRDAPPPLPAGTPTPLIEIVGRALAKAPKRRYANGGEMARALAGALAGASEPAAAAAVSRARPRSRARAGAHTRVRPRASVIGRTGGPPPPSRRTPGRRGSTIGRASAAEPRTRVAPRRNPRRTHNPSGRRRSGAALLAAFLLLGAMLTAAMLIGGAQRVRVPRLIGLGQARIEHRARALALRVDFSRRWSSRPRGTAVAQNPRPGRRIDQGAVLSIALSAGPPPVRVPQLAGRTEADARAALAQLGLRSDIRVIVAPSVPAGTVTSQSPAPSTSVRYGAAVTLNIAETPHWQPVTVLSGGDQTVTTDVRIRGSHWRIVYTMAYQGTCTLIVFCSGPTATVTGPAGGSRSFDLSDVGRQTQTYAPGPGRFTLSIAPGSDSARWTAWVEDWY